MRLPFFELYVRFRELTKRSNSIFLRTDVRYDEHRETQGGTLVPLKKSVYVRICERGKGVEYDLFRVSLFMECKGSGKRQCRKT